MKKINDEQLKKQLEAIAIEAQNLAQKQAKLYLKLENLKSRAGETRQVPEGTEGFSDGTRVSGIELGDLMA